VTPLPSDEALDSEVERMLRTFEGPEAPMPRPRRRRTRRRLAAVALAGAVLAAGIVAAVLVDGDDRPREAAIGTSPTCRTLELEGRLFRVRQVPSAAFAVGTPTADGTLRCGNARYSVSVARIRGVDPSVAVARPSVPPRVYAAEGVCPGRRGADLVACLRNTPVTP
jgi:hypothetical protein